MTANIADEIVRNEVRDALSALGRLYVAPSPAGSRRKATTSEDLTPEQIENLLDTCVAVINADQWALYLVNAAERGVTPTKVEANTPDMFATHRLLRKYAADVRLWSRFPEGPVTITELRALTLKQVALGAPVHDRADALLTLSDWFERAVPSLGRTRAVLAAEAVGSVLGHPAPSSRSGKRVRDRDDRRRERHQPNNRVLVDGSVQ